MSNKFNTLFLNSYLELDKVCCLKFGVVTGGVTEYINRLINARFAPDRDEVLPRLVRYRNIRNRMAHEAGALTDIDEINRLFSEETQRIREYEKELLGYGADKFEKNRLETIRLVSEICEKIGG